MKILLVTHGFPPHARGGTEIYTRDVARGMMRRGHDVTVLYRAQDPAAPDGMLTWGSEDGVPTVAVNNTYAGADLAGDDYALTYKYPALDAPFREVLQRAAPDVVHFTYLLGGLSASFVGMAASENIRTVVTLTDYHLLCPWGQLLTPAGVLCSGPREGTRCTPCFRGVPLAEATPGKSLCAPVMHALPPKWLVKMSNHPALRAMHDRLEFNRAMLSTADVRLAPTRAMQRIFVEHGIADVQHAPLAIDVSAFHAHAMEDMPQAPLRLGYIGSLRPHKGLHVLMDALERLDADDAAWRLDVIGDARDEDEAAYVRALPGLNAPNVRQRGALADDQLPAFFDQIDVLVIPSLWRENAPLVTHYCRATVTPAFFSDVPGLQEPLGEGGWRFPPGDAAALADRIGLVLRAPEEVTSRRGCMDPAPDYAKHLRELEQVYGA